MIHSFCGGGKGGDRRLPPPTFFSLSLLLLFLTSPLGCGALNVATPIECLSLLLPRFGVGRREKGSACEGKKRGGGGGEGVGPFQSSEGSPSENS